MSRLDDAEVAEGLQRLPGWERAVGGLTDRDFQLAARIQELDQPTPPA